MNPSPRRVYIHDVAPRDGFQIEPRFIPTERKIGLIDALEQTGLAKIEVTSFTSQKAVPALADAEAVMRGIARVPGVEFAVLVPNLRGCERALACGVDEINVVMSASASHNRANLRMSPEQSVAQIESIVRAVGGRAAVNISLSTAFGCPFEGDIPVARVVEYVDRFVDIGLTRMSLCDTTGMANPVGVKQLFDTVLARWPAIIFTAHFHNTRGMGLANALAAHQAGVERFDASLGGLGGCPYAPGATGNVCTEDLVHMFHAMGIVTGVDLDKLIEVSVTLPELVGHEVPSQVAKAGPWTRRYPMPGGPA
jgi:hydroxymethylglutaryl-CoA lyase